MIFLSAVMIVGPTVMWGVPVTMWDAFPVMWGAIFPKRLLLLIQIFVVVSIPLGELCIRRKADFSGFFV